MEEQKRLEALRRLGATIVACEQCGRQFALQEQEQCWVNIFIDGEVCWETPEGVPDSFLCCSADCATTARDAWNAKYGASEPHHLEAIYLPSSLYR